MKEKIYQIILEGFAIFVHVYHPKENIFHKKRHNRYEITLRISKQNGKEELKKFYNLIYNIFNNDEEKAKKAFYSKVIDGKIFKNKFHHNFYYITFLNKNKILVKRKMKDKIITVDKEYYLITGDKIAINAYVKEYETGKIGTYCKEVLILEKALRKKINKSSSSKLEEHYLSQKKSKKFPENSLENSLENSSEKIEKEVKEENKKIKEFNKNNLDDYFL